MCKAKKPKDPPIYPEAPAPAPGMDTSAGAGDRRRQQRQRGATQGGTLLTGGTGLSNPAASQSKTLLGG